MGEEHRGGDEAWVWAVCANPPDGQPQELGPCWRTVSRPAVERLNAPAWEGQGPFFEDWYAKANVPDQDASVWVRYTLRDPPDAQAEATVWAILDLDGEHVAAKETVPADALELTGDPFTFSTPHGDLESGACGGTLDEVRWEMTWDPCPFAFWALPRWAYEVPGVFAKTVTPNPRVAISGTVQAGERTLELDRAPGQQGHVWGAKHADAWAWAHNGTGAGPTFEVVAGRASVAGRKTPPLATVLVRWGGETLAFRNPLANRATFGADGLTVTGQNTRYRVEATVERDALVQVVYTDPDGERAWCHNTKRARGRLTLAERTWTGWRTIGTWSTGPTTAFEVGLRDPLADVPTVLG